jgi:hypothetical protein
MYQNGPEQKNKVLAHFLLLSIVMKKVHAFFVVHIARMTAEYRIIKLVGMSYALFETAKYLMRK